MKGSKQNVLERAKFFQNYFSTKPDEYIESEFEEGSKLSQLWLEAINYFVINNSLSAKTKIELKQASENCSQGSVRLIDLNLQVKAWLKLIEE